MHVYYILHTGEKLEDTWEDARKMLGNSNLLSLLQVRVYECVWVYIHVYMHAYMSACIYVI